MSRLSTGIPGLDEHLGGGLLPGALAVVVGSTGIGKTQFGLHFLHAGRQQEGRGGILFDMTPRGDSQNHAAYAERMFGWRLQVVQAEHTFLPEGFFEGDAAGDYLHVFDRQGKRVTRRDLEFEAWHDWQSVLARRLETTIGFFYGNFARGVCRAVIDGIEPVERASDSVQIELFEYIYHQILRKDPDWVARDLFRQHYRAHADEVARHQYDPGRIGCMMLYTCAESSLEAIIERPLGEGDVLANANTIIHLGKIREGTRFRRALHIAKHRGSACSDEIIPFSIDERGIRLEA
ncbi:MAG: RAD55 family ATPase [Planctomycetota bacterium]